MRRVIPAILGLTLAATGHLQAQEAVSVQEAEDRSPSLSTAIEWTWGSRIPALIPHPMVRMEGPPPEDSLHVPEEGLQRAMQPTPLERRRTERPNLDPPRLEEALREMERTVSGWILRSSSGPEATGREAGGHGSVEVTPARTEATLQGGSVSTGAVPQAGGGGLPW